VVVTRHYKHWRARQQFTRKLEQLHFELSVESPRRVLDYLIEHAEDLLGQIEASVLRDSLSGQLERAKRLVAGRHNLRLVKGL
jgi:hypothetical protein